MRAQIDQRFKNGFELTEESVLKIKDIIEARLKQGDGPLRLLAEVRRVDHALLRFDDIRGVFDEENGKTDKIVALRLFSDGEKDGDKIAIEFEKGEDTRLRISSEARDRALLTHTDLRDYLTNEVVTQKWSFLNKAFNHRITPLFVMLLVTVSMLWRLSAITKEVNLDPPLDPTTEEQIQYLYDARIHTSDQIAIDGFLLQILGIPIFALVAAIFLIIGWKYIYQYDLFIWGKEAARVQSLRTTLGRIFWTVLIGLAVSISGGLLLNFIGPR